MAISTREIKGFTLIEIVVVVAIVVLLAAIAYPSYVEHVTDSRRTVAQADMMELAQWMERNYTEAMSYNADSAGVNIVIDDLPFKKSPREGTKEYYAFALDNHTQTTFTITATPKNSQANDECGVLTLTHTGEKGNDSTMTVAECWSG